MTYTFQHTVKPLISTIPISTVPIIHGQESFPNPKSPLLGVGARLVFTPVNLIEQWSGVSLRGVDTTFTLY